MWNNLLIALTISGVCAAWDVTASSRPRFISKLDLDGEEMASFFINTFNNTLITISKYYHANTRYSRGDKYRLYCRAISLYDIQYAINLKENWRPLYAEESINHPGYIEFHSSEGIAVTMCCERKLYRVWSLKTNQILYQIPFAEQAIRELTITGSGCLCCVILTIGTDKKKQYGALTYRYIHALTGEVIKDVQVRLCTRVKLQDPDSVVENVTLCHTFGRWIIHKERNYNALIIDITTPSQDSGNTLFVDYYNSLEKNDHIVWGHGLYDNAELTFIEGTDTFLATYDDRIDIWDCIGRCIIGTSATSVNNSGFVVSGMYVSEKGGFVVKNINQCHGINAAHDRRLFEQILRREGPDRLIALQYNRNNAAPPQQQQHDDNDEEEDDEEEDGDGDENDDEEDDGSNDDSSRQISSLSPSPPIHQMSNHTLDACIKIFSTSNNPKMGIFPGKEVASLGGGSISHAEFLSKAKTYYKTTALFYDEDKKWIVTGDVNGNIHIWHA